MPSLHGVVEHRAVVDPAVFVAPRVAVGVEVNQRERAVTERVGPQQRQGDVVVAADAEHRRTRVQNVCGVAFDGRRNLRGTAVVQGAVPDIHDCEAPGRIEAPRPGRSPRELRGCGPDRARAQTRPRTVCGRKVERDTGDGDVDSVQVAGIRSPEEAERAGVGRLVPQPVG